MPKSPAFQFYPDAWLSSLDITLMTPAEEGAYIRLLCHAWLSPDCSLPTDSAALRTLSRLGPAWPKSEERIRSKFREEDGRLYNDRLLVERRKQDEWRRKSSEGGRKSVATKCQPMNKGGSRVVEKWLEPNGNSLSLVSVSDKTTTKPMPKTDVSGEWFASEFWPLWPVKENRKAAEVAARKLKPADRDAVLAALPSWAPRIKAMERPIHAATWLNNRRWEDEHHTPKPEQPLFDLEKLDYRNQPWRPDPV